MGTAVHKTIVALLIEVLMAQLGMVLQTPEGRRAYGGHAFRVGGSQHLARVGLGLRLIMLLARWGTEVILGYVKDAPLENLTEDYLKSKTSAASSSKSGKGALPKLADKSLKQLEELEKKYDEHDRNIEELRAKLDAVKVATEEPKYVVSGNLVWHKSLPVEGVPAHRWKVLCGWRYHASVFTRERVFSDEIKSEFLCDRCFKEELKRRRALEKQGKKKDDEEEEEYDLA